MFGNQQPKMDRGAALAMALASGAAAITGNQGAQANIANMVAQQQARRQGNRTLQYMQKAGIDPQLIALAKGNPDVMKEIAGAMVKAKLGGSQYMPKFSGIQFDPSTGQAYLTKADPNTGSVERIDIAGAIGQTPQQKIEMENAAALKKQDVQNAMTAGQNTMSQVVSIDGQIQKLQSAKNSLQQGAASGWLQQHMPAFNNATASLRNTATSLGIDIINSATFGALSEAELKLALTTAMPLGLSENELMKWIEDKEAAQIKLRNELWRQAQTLTSGIGYSEWIKQWGAGKGIGSQPPAQQPAATQPAPAAQQPATTGAGTVLNTQGASKLFGTN